MKLLYLGYFCAPELFGEISKQDQGLSYARQRWEEGFFTSLGALQGIHTEDITVVSFLPHTQVEVPASSVVGKIKVHYIIAQRNGVRSILGAMGKVRQFINHWIKQTDGEERIVFTYAANPLLMLPLLSSKPKNCKVISACSEVPAFRLYDEKQYLFRWAKKNLFISLHNRMSGYIFFSRHDNDVANPKNKPWIVCEGMAELPPPRSYEQNADTDVIFYAGGLNLEYGIGDLLDAFCALNRPKTELWLCGNGNAEAYINECIAKNPAIRYLGRVDNGQILKMESEVSLLVNPRPNDLLLTKYSFPSKTLEYMASGTPAMIRKLDGIPDEYYDYAYIIEESGADGIEKALREFFDEPIMKRNQMGKNARIFVEENKTPLKQTQRIIDFLMQEAAKK